MFLYFGFSSEPSLLWNFYPENYRYIRAKNTPCSRHESGEIQKNQNARMLCAPYCDLCMAGIVYSLICKDFTLNDFHITYNRWDQFNFRANNEIMVRQSNLIFHMHKQGSFFVVTVISIGNLALSSIE